MAYSTASKLVLGGALAGVVAAALGACTFNPVVSVGGEEDATAGGEDGGVDGPGQPDAPAGPDAGPDAFVPCWTWDPAHFEPCDLPEPSGALDIAAGETHVYNTDDESFTSQNPPDDPASAVITQADGTDAVIISVTDLTVDGELRVEGSRPLIVAASNTAEISGVVDVTSRLGETTGAGANHAACPAATTGEDDGGGGGGGGGGGFQGKGGDGGPGDSNDNNDEGGTSDGGPGGAAVAEVPATVRGGCPGAPGGQGDEGSPAPGGDGGGAVQITAQTSIHILGGDVLAGGSGGSGGPTEINGGSGGGSGGYIGLDAPSVELDSLARLAANGGGGGEGGVINAAGDDGSDGAASATPASGGGGVSIYAGNGGDGGAGTDLDGFASTQHREGGGGGGGGGVGYIIIRTADLQDDAALISPAATEQSP